MEEERRQEEELGRQEALRLSETAQIEKDYQYASELEERIKHEEVSESVMQYCTSVMCAC